MPQKEPYTGGTYPEQGLIPRAGVDTLSRGSTARMEGARTGGGRRGRRQAAQGVAVLEDASDVA